ncbi:MAG TPA: lamin tail domain-containing protein [Kofleriaceae bacterium]|nr:lamin tail domain-containing protein [Kofleriaceae bacterium]
MRRLAFLLAAVAAGCGPDTTTGACKDNLLPGDLVITEVFADFAAPAGGTGTDDGKEWFEIYNNADRPVSLKGVTIVHARPDGSKANTHTMTDVTIAPGQFFTLGNSTSDLVPAYVDYGYSADLGDFFNSDGGKLTLKCGDDELDSAVYDMVKSGHSRQLSNAGPPDYTLNDDQVNWCTANDTEFESGNFGTPGQDNDCAPIVAGACTDSNGMRPAVPPNPGDVVITEFMPKPTAVSATTGQWFEVKALADVDFNGVSLDRANDTAGPTVLSSPTCIHLGAGQYGIFARSDDTSMNGGLTALAEFPFSINPTSTPDLQILVGSTVIDAITWTTSTSSRSRQLDPDFMTSTANDDPASFCDAQAVYGAGPDHGTPGMPNEECAAQPGAGQCLDNGTPRNIVKPAAGALVINEFLANAQGSGTDTTQEWFEVVNTSGTAFDLNGLWMQGGTTTQYEIKYTNCKSVAPNGFALFAHGIDPVVNAGLPAVDVTFTFAISSTIKIFDTDKTTLIDAVTIPTSGTTAPKDGLSKQLKDGQQTTTANDDINQFCDAQAVAGQQYGAASDPNMDGLFNYGTPKAANVCP